MTGARGALADGDRLGCGAGAGDHPHPGAVRAGRAAGGSAAVAVISNGGNLVVDGRRPTRLAAGCRDAGSPMTARRWPRSATALDRRRRRAVGAQPQGRRRPVLLPGRGPRDDCPRPSWTTGPAGAPQRGWVVSMQGRKIYALPAGLTKEAALAEVVRRAGGTGCWPPGTARWTPACSAGRGRIRPPHGELSDTGWRAPHVRVADADGVLAGEEMSRWLAARLGIDEGAGSGRRGRPPQSPPSQPMSEVSRSGRIDNAGPGNRPVATRGRGKSRE